MHLKQPKSIYQFGLALLFAAFTFTACNNSGEKKEDAAKTDTTPKMSEPTPAGPDTPKTVDTLKGKPTAPGD